MKKLAGWLAAIGVAMSSTAPAAAGPPPAPQLVVAISVDQFSFELYERYRPTFTGGLQRLSDGLAFTGYQSHGATETCPGHSTILTGAHPARTGIVANSWYDRASGKTVYCASVADAGGEPDARGPEKLRVEALGDWLKRARPGARTVAVSGKDRGAIMMAGQHPDAVYWWKGEKGFVTSRFAGPTTPEVLGAAAAFNDARFAAWRASPPRLWPASLSARCAALQKPYRFGGLELSGRVPPQTAPDGTLPLDAKSFQEELSVSPELDRLTLAFADQLVDRFRLGRGPQPDLLAISLSGSDLIGHRYGDGGAEMCVQMAAIDAALGGFFDGLDRRGLSYVVVLTADHGAIDAAERLTPPAARIDGRAITRGLTAHLQSTFGLAYDPVAGNSRQVVLKLAPADAPRRAAVLAAALAWLKARPEVAAAYAAAEIVAAAPPRGKPVADLTLPERLAQSFDPERSGDILVAYAERATLGMPRAPGDSVAGHGSPWDYDRQVPILFWWRGVSPTRAAAPMRTVDIAPTLAPLLAIHAPEVDGRCVEIGQGCAPAAAASTASSGGRRPR